MKLKPNVALLKPNIVLSEVYVATLDLSDVTFGFGVASHDSGFEGKTCC